MPGWAQIQSLPGGQEPWLPSVVFLVNLLKALESQWLGNKAFHQCFRLPQLQPQQWPLLTTTPPQKKDALVGIGVQTKYWHHPGEVSMSWEGHVWQQIIAGPCVINARKEVMVLWEYRGTGEGLTPLRGGEASWRSDTWYSPLLLSP